MPLKDFRTTQLLEDVEHALQYGSRVSIICSDEPDVTGYVVDATRSSFLIETEGSLRRVNISDVLLFDFLDR